ncbi:MAG: toll/interleukin-1 receptor domain-containing protein [Bacteroidota bacterium]
MIFISHNHNDKGIIEPIAIKLAEIFGQDQVFYDTWSMQPGDGIIDKMNEGLEKTSHFFFFVSENSLKSNMVKMEWQNAIFKASKGNCKVIPVRLDSSSMPAILSQSLYIDLYSNGLDAAVGQMVNVIQGNSTYQAPNNKFSNLSFELINTSEENVEIKISANFYLEPIANFLILVDNEENELGFTIKNEGMFNGGFNKDVRLNNGKVVNVMLMKAPRGITPKMPLRISVTRKNGVEFKFVGLLHQASEENFEPVPMKK